MYLPTFWKMMAEAAVHKSAKMGGWGLPAGAMGKSIIDIGSQEDIDGLS